MRSKLLALGAGLMFGLSAAVAIAQNGDIVITNAWARAMPSGAQTAAAYITVESADGDRLTGVSTPAGSMLIEQISSGDLVITADGDVAPVLWVGRQTVSKRFADPLRSLPFGSWPTRWEIKCPRATCSCRSTAPPSSSTSRRADFARCSPISSHGGARHAGRRPPSRSRQVFMSFSADAARRAQPERGHVSYRFEAVFFFFPRVSWAGASLARDLGS